MTPCSPHPLPTRRRRLRAWCLAAGVTFAAASVAWHFRQRLTRSAASTEPAPSHVAEPPPAEPIVIGSSVGSAPRGLSDTARATTTRLTQALLAASDASTRAYPATEVAFLTKAHLTADDLVLTLGDGTQSRLHYLPGSKDTSPPQTAVFLSDPHPADGTRLTILHEGTVLVISEDEYRRAMRH